MIPKFDVNKDRRFFAKIFIGGPSGVGKTFVGNKLCKEYGWVHIDCELLILEKKFNMSKHYKKILLNSNQNVVLTWGLSKENYKLAADIINSEFYFIWLTGDQDLINKSLEARGEDEKFINDLVRQEGKDFINYKSPNTTINVFDEDKKRVDVASNIHERFGG